MYKDTLVLLRAKYISHNIKLKPRAQTIKVSTWAYN